MSQSTGRMLEASLLHNIVPESDTAAEWRALRGETLPGRWHPSAEQWVIRKPRSAAVIRRSAMPATKSIHEPDESRLIDHGWRSRTEPTGRVWRDPATGGWFGFADALRRHAHRHPPAYAKRLRAKQF